MFEMLLKSFGGYEGLIKLFLAQANISQEDAEKHIAFFREHAVNGIQRIAKIEADIAKIAKIAAALNIPLQEENENA